MKVREYSLRRIENSVELCVLIWVPIVCYLSSLFVCVLFLTVTHKSHAMSSSSISISITISQHSNRKRKEKNNPYRT